MFVGQQQTRRHHLPDQRLPLFFLARGAAAEAGQTVMAPVLELLRVRAAQHVDDMSGAETFAGLRHCRKDKLRLRRAVGVYSSGRIVNLTIARAQMIGGIIWGWGKATMEDSDQEPVHGRP